MKSVKNFCNMNDNLCNPLNYINELFKIYLDDSKNKDNITVYEYQCALLSLHDKILKELNIPLLRTIFNAIEKEPCIRHQEVMVSRQHPYNKIEIKIKD